MLVNPELPRGLANQAQIASTAISEAQVGRLATESADGVNCSTTRWAAHLVGVHVGTVEAKISAQVTTMGEAIRGAGDRYEVQDNDLAVSFTGLF